LKGIWSRIKKPLEALECGGVGFVRKKGEDKRKLDYRALHLHFFL